jgi:hypothetical protein
VGPRASLDYVEGENFDSVANREPTSLPSSPKPAAIPTGLPHLHELTVLYLLNEQFFVTSNKKLYDLCRSHLL